ncbi:hypothetical protein EV424DRAFT_1546149 [Suillus variegatus]|nr:hypothetical protein EV424DRAFT_1546149 [Suillus variegatus]
MVLPARSPPPDPPVNSHEEMVLPARSPPPDPPVNSDDDSPLTEEDEEIIQPAKKRK